jgi:hypothetical protein
MPGPQSQIVVFDLKQWQHEEAKFLAIGSPHPNTPNPGHPGPLPCGSIVWQGKLLSFVSLYNVPLKFGFIIVSCPSNLINNDYLVIN